MGRDRARAQDHRRIGQKRNSPLPATNPVTIGFHGAPWQGAFILSYLICAIGAATGWLAGMLMGTSGKIVRIEEVLVGIFGAFIGGDFLVSQIDGPTAIPHLSASSVGMAVAGAAVMLVLLRLMRGVVGPMSNSKSRTKQR